MKKRNIKNIKSIAQKIVDIEKRHQLGKSDLSSTEEIENIICSLSIFDLLEIDNYIMSKEMLTK